MSHYLGLIVKATRLCNLRCAYCHDWDTGKDQIMPFRVMATLTERALSEAEHQAVEFIWHGGEPTLLPMSFYEKAVVVQARLRRPDQIIQNSLQSNGTLITPEWARFLRDMRFHVSLSLDGPPELHDLHRLGVANQASFATVIRGIDTLREYGVPFSVLMVIDHEALALGPQRIFDFFLSQGISNYGLVAAKPTNQPNATPGTLTRHYVDPKAMTVFLQGLYDCWREHGDEHVHIREIDALLKRVRGQPAQSCTLAGACLGRYFLIEPNGEIAHCDLFLGDDRYTLGNVMTHRFSDLEQSPTLQTLRLERESDLNQMRGCADFDLCQGWCPHEHYLSVRHSPAHSPSCCGLSDLIRHIRTGETTQTPQPAAAIG